MVLVMSRPFRRPDTSFIHFRKRVPADIQRSGMGKMLVFVFPGDAVGEPDIVIKVPLGSEVKLSLRTRDPAIAKLRTGLVSAQLERMFNAWRQGPQRLTHRQRVALAGMVYQEFVEWLADDPGEASIWQTVRDAHLNARIEPQRMERWFGPTVDDLLLREGVITDGESRLALLAEVARVMIGAADRLERHATGDYRADDVAESFPAWEGVPTSADKARTELKAALTFDDLFGRWMREANPAPSTITTWRSYMKQLREHVGHDDPARVAKADIVAWKDALVAAGRTPKGIRDGQLAAVKSIFNYGLANDLFVVNPTAGVIIRQKKKAGTKMLGYSDAEVSRILALAAAQAKPDRRWLPWLMALSGARVGELAQLWGQRIVQVEGIWVMKIAPAEDGGTLKNEGSERDVPIHRTILDHGFLDFVGSRGNGPLFYRGRSAKDKVSRDAGSRHASKGVSNHLAAWVRDNGFDDERKAPNHALRHWFKTACQSAGVQDSVADAIQGHRGSRGEADTYRHTRVATMAEAIALIKVPRLEAEQGPNPLEDAVKQGP